VKAWNAGMAKDLVRPRFTTISCTAMYLS
jgi:hypothetical protein